MDNEIERLALSELVDMLHDLDNRRTPVGWSPDDAVEKSSVERRIVELVKAESAGDGNGALSCDVTVKLRTKESSERARVREIGPGGVFVETEGTYIKGTHVELQVRGSGSEQHGLRVRGKIVSVDGSDGHHGVVVSFAEQPSEAHERRLRRFVLEVVGHRLVN